MDAIVNANNYTENHLKHDKSLLIGFSDFLQLDDNQFATFYRKINIIDSLSVVQTIQFNFQSWQSFAQVFDLS